MSQIRERFKDEPIFLEVIEALLDLDQGKSAKLRKRARHRASEYLVNEGKLWRVAGGHHGQACTRVECVTKEEAKTLAEKEHIHGGYWGRDAIKKFLMDRVWSPGLDSSIVTAIYGKPEHHAPKIVAKQSIKGNIIHYLC